MGVLALAGAAVAAAGQLVSGAAQAEAYEYNAAVARMEGEYAVEASELEAQQFEEEIKRLLSSYRAQTGASGTVGDIGSNLTTQIDIQQQAAIDAALIRYEGLLGQWSAESQASLYEQYAKAATMGSIFGAGATILGGASMYDWSSVLSSYSPVSDPLGGAPT